jgi:hypothetical protein
MAGGGVMTAQKSNEAELEAELQRFNQEFGYETPLPKGLVCIDQKQRLAYLKAWRSRHGWADCDGPWDLAELLGAGHQPSKRATNPRLLGVVFEKLPLRLRRRWWRETDYGRRDASLELVAAIAAHVRATARKCRKMLKAQEKPTVT